MDLDHLPYFPRGLTQIAGVRNLDEARMLLAAGADLVGLPLRLTVNAEDLSEAEAAAISRALPGRCCLITYLQEPAEILEFAAFLGVQCLQLHGEADPGTLCELKSRRPELLLIKSLIIGKGPVAELESAVQAFAPWADAFITDTYNPATGAEGATGLVHDWEISRRLCRLSPRPVILAGGLRPDNVAAAIRQVRPYGVDVHTGVEDAAGAKDPQLVGAFVRAARAAFAGLS